MNKLELQTILDIKGVPEAIYSLNGLKHGECLCVVHENNKWKVLYNSRGRISYIEECTGEEAAYDLFFKIMKEDYGW